MKEKLKLFAFTWKRIAVPIHSLDEEFLHNSVYRDLDHPDSSEILMLVQHHVNWTYLKKKKRQVV